MRRRHVIGVVTALAIGAVGVSTHVALADGTRTVPDPDGSGPPVVTSIVLLSAGSGTTTAGPATTTVPLGVAPDDRSAPRAASMTSGAGAPTGTGRARSAAPPAPTCSIGFHSVFPGANGLPHATRCVERRLAQLGFAVIGPDAVLDPVGVRSLKRFAAQARVPWHGAAGPLLLDAMGIWSGPPVTGTCSVQFHSVFPGIEFL